MAAIKPPYTASLQCLPRTIHLLGEPEHNKQATGMRQTLSTTFASKPQTITNMPHSREPIVAGANQTRRRMAKTEKDERLARDRAEIAARVARFRETQQKFEREREQYCDTTLANAVNGSARPSFWR